MTSYLGTEDIKDQFPKAIDDGRWFIETGHAVDHTEDAAPSRDPVEIAQFALQATENGQAHLSGGLPSLLDGDTIAPGPKGPEGLPSGS